MIYEDTDAIKDVEVIMIKGEPGPQGEALNDQAMHDSVVSYLTEHPETFNEVLDGATIQSIINNYIETEGVTWSNERQGYGYGICESAYDGGNIGLVGRVYITKPYETIFYTLRYGSIITVFFYGIDFRTLRALEISNNYDGDISSIVPITAALLFDQEGLPDNLLESNTVTVMFNGNEFEIISIASSDYPKNAFVLDFSSTLSDVDAAITKYGVPNVVLGTNGNSYLPLVSGIPNVQWYFQSGRSGYFISSSGWTYYTNDVVDVDSNSSGSALPCRSSQVENFASFTVYSFNAPFIVTCGVEFPENSTGRRRISLSSSSSSMTPVTPSASQNTNAVEGSATSLSFTTIITEPGTYYFNVFQNSGSTLNVNYSCDRMKFL